MILIAALSVAPIAAAQDAATFDPVAVVAQQQRIRSDLDTGAGRYGGLPADARREVSARQDALFKLLEGRSYEDLSAAERSQVSETLAWIEAAPQRSGEERMVCERVKAMGSNRVERVCKTVAQRQAERDSARNRANKSGVDRALEQRNVCANASCGGAR
ncbi:hypothetical protein ASD53_13095 [Lysobacter sp. Root559]|nr:hypothetical protein ASD53_13095 [Lysobacter sp. Root559]